MSEYMGHAGIAITADRYAHLLTGARDQAVRQVDAFLADHQPARLGL